SAREATDAIKDMPIKIPPEITDAIFGHKRSMENILFQEGKFGTPGLEDAEVDYLFHMTTDEGRAKLSKLFEARFGTRQINPSHMSMLHRAVRGMGIDAANEAYKTTGIKIGKYLLKGEGTLFETDLNAIEAFRRMRSAKMQADGQLLIKAKDMFSRPRAEAPPGWEELSFMRSRDPRYKKFREVFKDAMFDPAHAKHLNALTEFVTQPGQMGGFMDMLWKLRGNWVASTLYSPVGGTATLVKNEAGNLFNNWLAGMGPDAVHWYGDALGLMNGRLKKITLNGVEYTLQEMIQKLKDFAIFGGGYGPSEMSQFLQKDKREPFVLKGKYNPLRQLEKAYRVSEDNSRIAHFLWSVDKGHSFMEARASVKKYLFDYMIQSDLDRKIRTFVPFYQWTKNNIPLQLSSIVKNPFNKAYVSMSHMASLLRDNQAARVVDQFHKSVLPDFVKEQIGIPVSVGEDGNP